MQIFLKSRNGCQIFNNQRKNGGVSYVFSHEYHRYHTAYKRAEFKVQGKEKLTCYLNRHEMYVQIETFQNMNKL